MKGMDQYLRTITRRTAAYAFDFYVGANFGFDLKRIIALSTLRQLGLMIMTISIGLSGLAFFHLLFKALLFICAGGVIHSIGDYQDIRFMGGFSVYTPFTSSSLMVSSFALCGMRC
jgi:NADH-ubiquinone oxidoreductase chain 5